MIANRGEIALRILRTLREMGVESILACSAADMRTQVPLADRVICIGPEEPGASYLNSYQLIGAAVACGADAIHPGYGFLAEDAGFVGLCREMGMGFIGPSAEVVEKLGDKMEACLLAGELGLPTLLIGVAHDAGEASLLLGSDSYPAMLKPVLGGGGKGIRVAYRPGDLESAWHQAYMEIPAAFRGRGIYIEHYLPHARHLEVQVARDAGGGTAAFPIRECSLQHRYQKWIEETPPPSCPPGLEETLREGARRIAEGSGLVGIATVEFLVRGSSYYFLEVNPRLQVEHTVTELITGRDLVREQMRLAGGEDIEDAPRGRGHAIEARLYALPRGGAAGIRVRLPGGPGIRIDAPVQDGAPVDLLYDTLLAKICSWSPTREHDIRRMRRALEETNVAGGHSNLTQLRLLVGSGVFERGGYDISSMQRILGE